jgi:hypothetical protein
MHVTRNCWLSAQCRIDLLPVDFLGMDGYGRRQHDTAD